MPGVRAQYAKDNGFDVDVVEYLETDDLLNALDDGTLDAIAITYLGSNSRFRTIAQFSPEPIHFAFPLDRAVLEQDLTAAMNRLGCATGFSPRCCTTVISASTPTKIRVHRGRVRLPRIRAHAEGGLRRVPHAAVYTDPETGAFDGAAARLFEDISRVTGLTFEFVPVDRHDDAFEMVESGEGGPVAGVDRDADEATKGIVSTTGPYLRDPWPHRGRTPPRRLAHRPAAGLRAGCRDGAPARGGRCVLRHAEAVRQCRADRRRRLRLC